MQWARKETEYVFVGIENTVDRLNAKLFTWLKIADAGSTPPSLGATSVGLRSCCANLLTPRRSICCRACSARSTGSASEPTTSGMPARRIGIILPCARLLRESKSASSTGLQFSQSGMIRLAHSAASAFASATRNRSVAQTSGATVVASIRLTPFVRDRASMQV